MRYTVRKVVIILETTNACNDVERAMALYARRVQSLAFVYLKNQYDAEDVAQEVFLTYLRRAPRFASAQKERSWLMTVTANKCKSLMRMKCREDQPLTEDLSYLPGEESALMEAVLRLEKKYRLAIHLHYYEGYSLEEIGKLLHAKPGTVGSWLSRAREKLKKELEADYFEE